MRDAPSFRFGAWALASAAVLALQLTAGPARADTVSVFVGYADNLRASGFFPTPFLGDPNVVSQSSAAQTFDSGAIRIDNTGPNAITITNFQVHFPSNNSTFTLWNDLVIGAGQTGIFAQNNGNDTQFDTSDFGIFGGLPPGNLAPTAPGNNQIGGCSSPAGLMTAQQVTDCGNAVPVISFSENGNLLSFNDTGHILDTGEWDFVNNNQFGEDGNESINWNLVGSAAVRGGTSVPEPESIALFGSALGLLAFARRRRATK